MESLNPLENLPKAFEKCGLYPINCQKVVERIPSITQTQDIARNLDQALLKKLETRRFGDGKKKPRGQKVPAGQSYTKDAEDTSQEDSSSEEEVEASTDEEEETSDKEEEESDGQDEELPDLDGPKRACGSHVVAIYEGEWFIAEVVSDQTSVPDGYVRLSYMLIKGSNSFIWPPKPDLVVTLEEDILLEVTVQPVNSRGHLGLSKKDYEKVVSLMVVVYDLMIIFPFFSYPNVYLFVSSRKTFSSSHKHSLNYRTNFSYHPY
jgi:hypothetical protein